MQLSAGREDHRGARDLTDYLLIFVLGLAMIGIGYALVKVRQMGGPKKKMERLDIAEARKLEIEGRGRIIEYLGGGMASFVVTEMKKEEVPIEKVPGRISYEIVAQRDVIGGSLRTQTQKTGKISKRKRFLDWQQKRYFPNHVIKETVGKRVRYIIRWNVNYSEAMDKEGNVEYSQELENLDMNDMMMQLKKAVGILQGFFLDRNMQLILVMAAVFGIPIGFSYNDIFHWIPPTVVHWIP